MTRRPARWIGLALLLAGCDGAGPGVAVQTTSTADDWLLTANGPPATMTAGIEGSIVIDVENQCVWLTGPGIGGGDGRILVVFTSRTRLDLSDPDEPALILPNRDRLVTGDRLSLGGGAVSRSLLGGSEGSYAGLTVPDTCPGDEVWLSSGAL
ncbi:MAG: hypothetical protein OEX04_00645 [Acidimicrobiia bacterium]|nr:hypothetical protein [Acidimicrobiia bacterium]MDH4305962.1 hypothetical protein [Acidimicrobiia bacterium]MDH5292857.1 hypothetical protein [Acidimicrobiia bacterium]